MAARGKPAKIDLVELEKLAALQCTDAELASWFNVSTRTIERKRKNPRFAEVLERGRNKGKVSLRRQQLRLVERGNPALAIWLGKQWLGQVDRQLPDATGMNVYVMTPSVSVQSGKELGPCAQATIDIGPGEE